MYLISTFHKIESLKPILFGLSGKYTVLHETLFDGLFDYRFLCSISIFFNNVLNFGHFSYVGLEALCGFNSNPSKLLQELHILLLNP